MKKQTMSKQAAKKAAAKAKLARGAVHMRPPAAKPGQDASAKPSTALTVRVPKRDSYSITLGPDFKRKAMYWEYVLRNRIRWLRDGQVPFSVTAGCVKVLAEMGLDATRLKEIAEAGAVEIEIPYTTENEGWEFRIFPWEFMLDCGTSGERRGAALIVLRHIRCEGTGVLTPRAPKKFMVVESAPGPLDNTFSFISERRLVQANLGLDKKGKVVCPSNPTADELMQTIGKERPDIIHLAGVDSHLGNQLLKMGLHNERDGYMMSKPDGTPEIVDAERLALVLKGDVNFRARLVACNFYNSAARVAAMIAAQAADAAIGFQDEVDDRAAEEFYANFYFAWRTLGWDLLKAFRVAISESKLGGALVVLWSTQSLLVGFEERSLQEAKAKVLEERKKPSTADFSTMDPRDVLDLKITLKGTINLFAPAE